MNSRYSRGKIYKLIDTSSDLFYVGSTCSTLSHRLGEHKAKAKKKPAGVHRHFNEIGWENARIILIESVTAETKDQLLMREQHFIDQIKPVLNKQAAYARCPHGKKHCLCTECGGASICTHGRHKSKCKDCGGSQICSHGRQKSTCKDCGGSQICSHNRQKSNCKECNGNKHFCVECQQAFSSSSTLNKHKKSKKHLSKLA
jgi:hypothetical protein